MKIIYLVILYKNFSQIVRSGFEASSLFSFSDILHNLFPKHNRYCNEWPSRTFLSNNSFIMSYHVEATRDLTSTPDTFASIALKILIIL